MSDSIVVITLTGELDVGRRAELAAKLQVPDESSALLIDCGEVTYADSAALSELLRLRKETDQRRIPLALILRQRQFIRLIQYAGLDEAFAIFDDRGGALSYLATERGRIR